MQLVNTLTSSAITSVDVEYGYWPFVNNTGANCTVSLLMHTYVTYNTFNTSLYSLTTN